MKLFDPVDISFNYLEILKKYIFNFIKSIYTFKNYQKLNFTVNEVFCFYFNFCILRYFPFDVIGVRIF